MPPNNPSHGGGSKKKKKVARSQAQNPTPAQAQVQQAVPEVPEVAEAKEEEKEVVLVPEDVVVEPEEPQKELELEEEPKEQDEPVEEPKTEMVGMAIPTEEPKPTQIPPEEQQKEEETEKVETKKSKKDKKKKKKSASVEAEEKVEEAVVVVVAEENPKKKKENSEDVEEEEERVEDVTVIEKTPEEEKQQHPVAPTAEEDGKISGDLLDFSSSDDRSSLSSRPIVKDSPEEDEDDVHHITRPEALLQTAPKSTIQSRRSAPPAQPVEEMLVDMSLDDDHPSAPPRKTHSLNSSSTQQRQAPPPIPSMNTIISSKPRVNQGIYPRGQIVKQSAVEQQTLANQMVDLMAMSMSGGKSQSQGGAQVAAEKAEWVQLTTVEKAGDPNERLEVLIVGLCRGYQIWTMGSTPSDFEEVLSERQGPIRALKVLPNNLRLRGKKDPYAESRPLIAIVDAQSHHPDRQYCSVSIKSLLTGKEVKKLDFDEPVCAVNVSDRFLVVSLANRAIAYSILTFEQIRLIRTAPSVENNPPALSLSCQLLAYADTKLDGSLQSSGGLAAEVETAATEKYTDHLFNAMSYFSRGVKSISESVGATSGNSLKNNQPQGVITVLDLSATTTTTDSDDSEGVMCHYVAHVDPISYIAFSPDQRLVLSADANANGFNIFLLMPHATTSSLASVQHLYKLNRGNTPAKVISSAFSEDCRWLAITTNHATTHVFAVCPFGGKPNQRTHGDTFVNKESRFHRSAGLTDAADVTALIGPSRHRAMADSCSYTKDHPIAVNSPTLAKTNGNSRVGPFPPPLLLTATEKIKDSRYTKEDLTAWAADMTSFSYQGTPSNAAVAARKRLEVSRMSVLFRMRSSNSTTCNKTSKTTKTLTSMSLIVAKVDPAQGVIVMQHEIKPIRKETPEPNFEAPPQIDITPAGGWILQRTKNNADIHAPMNSQCPLMANAVPDQEQPKRVRDEEVWTPHVETRTYSHPPRWLWQGPQFGLFEYREDDQPCLMSPGNKGSNASFKSIPVLVGSEAIAITKKAIPADATRIECGSYTSANSYNIDQCSDMATMGSGYTSTTNGDFVATIADAMRDISSDDDFHKKASPRAGGDDDEFFDTESSTSFARNGSGGASNGTSNGKSAKKKKTPPASAPPPPAKAPTSNSSKKSNGSSSEANRSNDADDFGTFDMDDI